MSELEEIKARAASRQLGHNRNHRGTGDLLRETEADLDRAIAIAKVAVTLKESFFSIAAERVKERNEARAELARRGYCRTCTFDPVHEPEHHPECPSAQLEKARADNMLMAQHNADLMREVEKVRTACDAYHDEAIEITHQRDEFRAVALAMRDKLRAFTENENDVWYMMEGPGVVEGMLAETEWLEEHR